MNAIVTGASRGIGRAFCLELAKRSYDLFIIARGLEGLNNLRAELLEINKDINVTIISADLSKRFEAQNAAQSVLHNISTIDVLVNNAGLYGTAILGEHSIIEDMLNQNFKSAYYFSLPFIDTFKKTNSGCVINICSVLSKESRVGAADYSIAKHALYGFSKALKEELNPHGIKVLHVLPGSVNTSSWDGSEAPLDELIQAEDVARVSIEAVSGKSGTLVDEIVFSASNPLY